MNKIERVDASLSGQSVDRPPVSFWYHFGVQHAGGERIAELELEFFNYYDLDYLKVMNDYYYPMPAGIRAIKTRDDLRHIRPFEIEATPWKEQLKALDIIAKELEGKAYFLDTIFDPWQVLLRNLLGENLMRLIDEAPEAVLEALDTITENVLNYCKAAVQRGAAGLFVSTFGAEKQIPKELYMKFAFPFVDRLLRETKNLTTMNTAHIHDYGIYVDECVKLPAHIISYEDTHPSNPSMPEMRKKWKGSIMAGMDKNQAARVTPEHARQNALAGIKAGGSTNFLLAPGCSFPTWLYPDAAKTIVEAVKSSAK